MKQGLLGRLAQLARAPARHAEKPRFQNYIVGKDLRELRFLSKKGKRQLEYSNHIGKMSVRTDLPQTFF